MMKTNQDIIKDGLTEQTVDIFIENSGYIQFWQLVKCNVGLDHFQSAVMSSS